VLFAADGKLLTEDFPSGLKPVNWTGGPVRELLSADGRKLWKYNGKGLNALPQSPNPAGGNCVMSADLAGDFRDEIVCVGKTAEGAQAVFVYTNTDPAASRDITRTADREYRIWIARNIGGGYPSYFEWQP
jgi:hypothetical protein